MAVHATARLAVDVVVRDLVGDDLGALWWAGDEAHVAVEIPRQLERSRTGEVVQLCATVRDRPVGLLAVDLVRHAGIAVLWQLAVHPELQGVGIGTTLIRAGEDVARAAGKVEAELDVTLDNDGARRLYERLGYRVVGEDVDEWERRWPDGRREVVRDRVLVMRLALG